MPGSARLAVGRSHSDHVAERQHLRMTGQGKVGLDRDPARGVELGPVARASAAASGDAPTRLALVAGFGGLRDVDGELRFHPRLPREWERLRFRGQARGQPVEVNMTNEATTYRLLEGHGILVRDFGDFGDFGDSRPPRRSAG
jgi:Glycosyl hydrolase family 65, C-terminal domain